MSKGFLVADRITILSEEEIRKAKNVPKGSIFLSAQHTTVYRPPRKVRIGDKSQLHQSC